MPPALCHNTRSRVKGGGEMDLLEKLGAYARSGACSMHMPGHKGAGPGTELPWPWTLRRSTASTTSTTPPAFSGRPWTGPPALGLGPGLLPGGRQHLRHPGGDRRRRESREHGSPAPGVPQIGVQRPGAAGPGARLPAGAGGRGRRRGGEPAAGDGGRGPGGPPRGQAGHRHQPHLRGGGQRRRRHRGPRPRRRCSGAGGRGPRGAPGLLLPPFPLERWPPGRTS